MSPSVVASSISNELRASRAAALTMFRERMHLYGMGYGIDLIARPIFDVSIAALIYTYGDRERVPYVVVALAASTFLFSAIYFVGEILDRERVRGTLPNLFLTPCRRVSWMAGYASAGIGETFARIAVILLAGMLLFGVRLDPNLLALAVVLPLFLVTLSGIALVLSGIGLYIKRANSLSNLVSPVLILLGGVYFPVSALPDPLYYFARALPLGYGMDAITAVVIDGATLGDISDSLWPLVGFAIASPVIGLLAFGYIDVLVRRRGEVDIY
jgi:ABC-2 type transport system permease protein